MVFLFIFITLFILIIFSKLKVEIDNFNYDSFYRNSLSVKIIIKLYIIKILPIFKITINKIKLVKISNKIKRQMLKSDKIELIENYKKTKILKQIKIKIKNMKLKVQIGTKNASIAPIIIAIISTLIAFFMRWEEVDYDNSSFRVEQTYINQNVLKIRFSSIFEIKMVHIMNIICILIKNKKLIFNKTSE